MLGFKDFYPKIEEKGGFFSRDKWQPLNAALEETNAWLAETQVQVLNVETVLLPNVWNDDEDGPQDAELRTAGEHSSYWHQIIRVWYMQN